MNDLRDRFASLGNLPSPSLRVEIDKRAAAMRPAPWSPGPVTVAVGVLAVAILGGVASIGSRGFGQPSAMPGSPAAATPVAVVAGEWTATGSMAQARQSHSATLLRDGRVLVAGGFDRERGGREAAAGLASAELYDPKTGVWTPAGSMSVGRGRPAAVLLRDGTVLVIGGISLTSTDDGVQMLTPMEVLASAELYDPRTGTWAATGSMADARAGGTATLLPDGRVLVAGGWGAGELFGPKLASAELYDPATRTWTETGSMSAERDGHAAVLLPDGKVLVAGGYDSDRLRSAELYDPVTGVWSDTGRLPERFIPDTAALLLDGTVLIAGGDVPTGPGAAGSAHAALYDISAGTWTPATSMIQPRLAGADALLPDGRVIVMGGRMSGAPDTTSFAEAELYDATAGTWKAIPSMTVARAAARAVLLLDGRVLVVGGVGNGLVVLASAELFELAAGS